MKSRRFPGLKILAVGWILEEGSYHPGQQAGQESNDSRPVRMPVENPPRAFRYTLFKCHERFVAVVLGSYESKTEKPVFILDSGNLTLQHKNNGHDLREPRICSPTRLSRGRPAPSSRRAARADPLPQSPVQPGAPGPDGPLQAIRHRVPLDDASSPAPDDHLRPCIRRTLPVWSPALRDLLPLRIPAVELL